MRGYGFIFYNSGRRIFTKEPQSDQVFEGTGQISPWDARLGLAAAVTAPVVPLVPWHLSVIHRHHHPEKLGVLLREQLDSSCLISHPFLHVFFLYQAYLPLHPSIVWQVLELKSTSNILHVGKS